MGMRGTSLFLNLPMALPEELTSQLGPSVAGELLVAVQEDLLDLVVTWRRVGREREVLVFLSDSDDGAVHRVARRGVTIERGDFDQDTLRRRARRALGEHRSVAVFDRPPPDLAMSTIDSLLRKSVEGLAVVADLSGGWLALGLSAPHRAVFDEGQNFDEIIERARLLEVPVHPLTPHGRIDALAELEALAYRIHERRARAPRSRRFITSHPLVTR